MRNIAVILSAGSGKRFGAGRPKQFLRLAGQTILEHSLDAFQENEHIDEICVVSHPEFLEETETLVRQARFTKIKHVIVGGKERYDSSLNAIRLYEYEHDVCLIFHDAVRPLVSQRIISEVCERLKTAQAVDVAIPTTDTLVECEGEKVKNVPPRHLYKRVQTPQGFLLTTIREAYDKALQDPNFSPTDDCGVVAAYLPEVEIAIVAGEEQNMKLTYPDDLPILEHLYSRYRKMNHVESTNHQDEDFYLRKYREQELRPLQLKMLEMLTIITDILERNGVRYWMQGGTLLGAMRHGGFIPWDDDMDIDVLAEDAEKMKEALRRELPPHLILPEPTKKSPTYKVRDLNSFFVEYTDDFALKYPKGVFIDIFLKVECPTVSRKFAKKVAKNYCRANSILHKQHYYSLRSFAEFFYFGAMRVVCKVLWTFAEWFCPKGKYVSMELPANGCGLIHDKSYLFPLQKLRFEDRYFYAPADPDYFLTESFGDWRKLPPEDQRQVHAVFYDVDLTR